MAKPIEHAKNSVKKWGGKYEDYLPIHNFMDCSKSVMPDCRHRALTHTTWFIENFIDLKFGPEITNSKGKKIPTRDIAEQHIMEDFGGYIPSVENYLSNMEIQAWMHNHGETEPVSARNTTNFVDLSPREEIRYD